VGVKETFARVFLRETKSKLGQNSMSTWQISNCHLTISSESITEVLGEELGFTRVTGDTGATTGVEGSHEIEIEVGVVLTEVTGAWEMEIIGVAGVETFGLLERAAPPVLSFLVLGLSFEERASRFEIISSSLSILLFHLSSKFFPSRPNDVEYHVVGLTAILTTLLETLLETRH
jgi:hypothetical protein